MLSAVPLTATSANFVGEPLELHWSSGTMFSITLPSTAPPIAVLPVGGTQTGLVILNLGPDPIVVSGGFGSTSWNAAAVPDEVLTQGMNSHGNGDSMPWQTPFAPVLDPIALPLQGLANLRPTAGGPGLPSLASSTASSTDSSQSTLVSFGTSMPLNNPRPIATGEADIAGARWLSAAFTPTEQQHLETSMAQQSSNVNPVARESQSRLALEPTRLISQSFCVVASVQPSSPAVSREPADPAPTGLTEGGNGEAPLRGQPPAPPHSAQGVVPSTAAAAHDAALGDWAPADLSERVPSKSTYEEGPIPRASVDELVLKFPGDDSASWQDAAQFFSERKRLIGALLAAVAIQTLWSYDENELQEKQPRRLVFAST
jgi:hypothetical protein